MSIPDPIDRAGVIGRRLFSWACGALFIALFVNRFIIGRGDDIPFEAYVFIGLLGAFSTDRAFDLLMAFLGKSRSNP